MERSLDPGVARSWLAVVASDALASDRPVSASVAGVPLVLWRSADDAAHVWADRCPHRGAALSLGRIEGDTLQCPYHGWRFGSDARCLHWPAHPEETPAAGARAHAYPHIEAYGLVWVCLGEPSGALLRFPAYGAPGRRAAVDGPYEVHAAAPRLIENFLDLAHFPFVHPGVLGEVPHTAVADYEVVASNDGIESRGCRFWQPVPSGLAKQGASVEYTYRVSHPLVASFGKLAGQPDAFDVLMVTSPIDATHTRLWKINVFGQCSDAEVARSVAFSRAAMLQDIPIVESQRPKPLPLDPRVELHQRADRLAAAYRRWLREQGWTYGVIP